jgi:hypothetical protein
MWALVLVRKTCLGVVDCFTEAAWGGEVDEFERLAKSRVDGNSSNSAGRIPLHTSCSAP